MCVHLYMYAQRWGRVWLHTSSCMNVCAGSRYAHLLGGLCTCVCLSVGRMHAYICTVMKEYVTGMGAYQSVCPSVCSERACLCPLGFLCPQVTEAAACRACYDMFIGLSTLMHFKFPTQGDPDGLQSHLFLALL